MAVSIDTKNNRRISRLIREADKAMVRWDGCLSRLSAALLVVPKKPAAPDLRREIES
jgi:hypothetical protein